MDINKATVCYFTGTGTTEKYAKAFADGLPFGSDLIKIDIRNKVPQTFGQSDLFVLAAPVYGGFISPFIWKRLADVKADGTPAVAIAVYGARDYDNALLEMQAELGKKGFTVVGAAAVVARHSIVQSIAPDRPSTSDLDGMRSFAARIADKVAALGSAADAEPFSFKGTLERPAAGDPLVPIATDDCIECGVCVDECPTGAIPSDAPATTDAGLCATCLSCVDVCPNDARKLPDPVVEKISGMLADACDATKANEFFE